MESYEGIPKTDRSIGECRWCSQRAQLRPVGRRRLPSDV